MTTLGVKVDEALKDRLKAMAEQKDRSTHWIIKQAIQEYLTREEAIERDRREDREHWERYAVAGVAIDNATAIAWMDDLAAGRKAPWPG